MSHPRIRLYPDPILRKKAVPVNPRDPSIRRIFKKMEQVMRDETHGIGIAAPQIGISKQLAIVDLSSRIPGFETIYLINPKILKREKELVNKEGCMSIPEYSAYVRRFEKILFSWQDFSGKILKKYSTGLEAICIQHEVDHLLGSLFLDHVACLKTDMIPRKFSRSKRV